MVAVALGSSALSLVGGALGNRSRRREAQRSRDHQTVEAQKNRDFQNQQSSTAHQREVLDLRAAGLNPILSGTGGAGAATSAGSMAGAAMAQQEDVLTPAVSTAMQARRNAEEVKNMKEQNKLLIAETLKTEVDTRTSGQLKELYSQQQDKELANTQLLTDQVKLLKEQTGSAESLNRINKNEADTSDIEQKVIQTSGEKERRIIERWLRTIGIGGSSAKQFSRKNYE